MDNSEKMAKKLGVLRCVLVRPDPIDIEPPPKDANDALRYMHKSFDDLRRLNPHLNG